MAKALNTLLEETAADLEDPTYEVWSKSDLLGFAADGLGQMAKLDPDEFTSEVDIVLVDGAQQAVPANVLYLVTPVCNLVAGSPDRAIRAVSLASLDRAKPSWRTVAASDTTRQIAVDPRSTSTFYVSPPANSGNSVRVAAVVDPTYELELDGDVPVRSEYYGPLKNYIMFRAYARDGDAAAQPARAAVHWSAFLAGMGVAEDGAA